MSAPDALVVATTTSFGPGSEAGIMKEMVVARVRGIIYCRKGGMMEEENEHGGRVRDRENDTS